MRLSFTNIGGHQMVLKFHFKLDLGYFLNWKSSQSGRIWQEIMRQHLDRLTSPQLYVLRQRSHVTRSVGNRYEIGMDKPGSVQLSVVRPCLHGAVCHCQIQNNLVIRSQNGKAIVQYDQCKILFSE